MPFDRAQDRLMDACACLTQPGQFYFMGRRGLDAVTGRHRF